MADALAATAILASLADPERLKVFATLVLAESDGMAIAELRQAIPGADRRVAPLITAGLVSVSLDRQRLRANPEAFRAARIVEEGTSVDGPIGQLFSHGRLVEIPRRRAARAALLMELTERLFAPEEVYREPEVNERLAKVYDDHATLRRYLVDAGLLERSVDGREYRVAAGTGRPQPYRPGPSC